MAVCPLVHVWINVAAMEDICQIRIFGLEWTIGLKDAPAQWSQMLWLLTNGSLYFVPTPNMSMSLNKKEQE